MWTDPIVDEMRRIKEARAARYDYDVRAMLEALRRDEQASGQKTVSFPPKRVEQQDAKH